MVRREGAERLYLVVASRRNPGNWVLPKGRVEAGESVEEAALREVREEAGVEAQLGRSVGTIEFHDGRGEVQTAYFLMELRRLVPPAEDRAVRWLRFEEARALLTYAESRQIVEAAAAEPTA